MQRLYGATLQWAAKTKPRWTPADTALAAALQLWASKPSAISAQRALALRWGAWTASKHALGEYFTGQSGVGEYFAPTSGMGEYFTGQSGLGDIPATCSTECADALSSKHKTQLAILVPGSLAMGLLVGMFVFR